MIGEEDMSKFTKVKQNDYAQYILEKDMNYLIDQLKKIHDQYKSLINDYVNEYFAYQVIELSDEFILTIKKSNDSATQLAIGYPFSIYTETIGDFYDGANVRLSIRGVRLRNMQRQFLLDKICSWYSSSIVEYIGDSKNFRKVSGKIINSKEENSLLYIDPNLFIGDSIIELSIVDNILDQTAFNKVCIVTKNERHLSGNFDVCSYDYKKQIQNSISQSSLVLILDLVDTHLYNTLSFLEEYKPNIPIFILSRNIIINPQKTGVKITCFDGNDILLTHQGIHNYIDDLIKPFFDFSLKTKSLPCDFKNKDTIFINIFSSLMEKDLDVAFIMDFIRYIYFNTNYKILLSTGIESDYTNGLINEINRLCRHHGFESRIEYIKDTGLIDLERKLQQHNILAAITPDTSISHLLTRYGYVNFTFYHLGFWDNHTIQSIAGESPVGYCSSNQYQIPVIRSEHKNNLEISKAILTIIKNLVSDDLCIKNSELKNLKYGYNYHQNRILYDEVLNTRISKDLKESICTIYDLSLFSLEYERLRRSEVLIKNVFEISPLTKIISLLYSKIM